MSDKDKGADFSSDLEAWLDAATAADNRGPAAPTDRYVVDRVLKETPYETTQVVYRRNGQGQASIGPFVRKRFVEDVGRGHAYDQILQAQAVGIRLEHQPLIYECEHTAESVDVVMEYLQGMTLDALVTSEGPGVGLVSRVMPQLCDALTELHEKLEQPLIHRDVKPSNVMLCNGRVKLIDLGIARAYHAGATRDTVRYGTPGYAPPEQFGYGQTSVRSDVYALGMTLAFCLTGREPTAEFRESGFADPRVPQAFANVLKHATEFDPANRYASARDLRSAIDAALRVSQGAATTPSPTPVPHSTPVAGPFPVPSATPSPNAAGGPSSVPVPGTVPIPGATPGPHAAPTPPRERERARDSGRIRAILDTIGRVWNAIITVLWVLMTISVIVNIVQPRGEYLRYPGWFNALMFLGLLYVPWTLVSYLLLDKRRLRRREPFSRWTWRREVPICLGVSAACMIVVAALYYALFR